MAWTVVHVAAQRAMHDSKDGNDDRSKSGKESKNLMSFKASILIVCVVAKVLDASREAPRAKCTSTSHRSLHICSLHPSQHDSSCIDADENTANCSKVVISASTRQKEVRGSKELDLEK